VIIFAAARENRLSDKNMYAALIGWRTASQQACLSTGGRKARSLVMYSPEPCRGFHLLALSSTGNAYGRRLFPEVIVAGFERSTAIALIWN
jgi:hypothetical protein